MAITPRGSLRHQSRLSPLLRHGVVLRIVPGNAAQDVEIDRAPDSGGSPGTFANIDRVTPPAKSGFLYVDVRPFSTATWWYRARQVGVGINPGSYAASISTGVRRLDDEHLMSAIASEPTFARTEDLNAEAVTEAKIGDEAVTPSRALGRLRCRVGKTGTQSLTSLSAADISFNTEAAAGLFDVGTLHDNSTQNQRITFPAAGTEGSWLVRGSVPLILTTIPAGATFAVDLIHSVHGVLDSDFVIADGTMTIAWLKLFAMVPPPAAGDYVYMNIQPAFVSGSAVIATGAKFEALYGW